MCFAPGCGESNHLLSIFAKASASCAIPKCDKKKKKKDCMVKDGCVF